jgi:hypothetical protein
MIWWTWDRAAHSRADPPRLVATAQSIDAGVVGAGRVAVERLGSRYLRFR